MEQTILTMVIESFAAGIFIRKIRRYTLNIGYMVAVIAAADIAAAKAADFIMRRQNLLPTEKYPSAAVPVIIGFLIRLIFYRIFLRFQFKHCILLSLITDAVSSLFISSGYATMITNSLKQLIYRMDT